MDRPRVVSVISKDAEERTPPDEAGVRVLESYVPAGKEASSQEAGAKPLVSQQPPAQEKPPKQKPGFVSGLFGSIFSKISSLFRR